MSEDINPARLRVLGQLEEVEQAIQYWVHRKALLESALKDISQAEEMTKYPSSFAFSELLDADGGLWRFLKDKILEPHVQKDGLKYVVERKGKQILSIRWSEVDENHTKEIVNAASWCEKRAQEAIAKA